MTTVDQYIIAGPEDVLIVHEDLDIIEVATSGPQGPPGPDGVPGPLSMTFGRTGDVTIGVGTTRWYNDFGAPIEIASVRASVGTAPTGSPIVVDVNIDGTTIYTNQANRPSIASGDLTDLGGTPDVVTVPAGGYITADVDAIGSGTPGANLSIQVVFVNT